MARHREPTLRGRVSALGLGVVAAWLVVVTVAFNLVLAHRLAVDRDSALRTRAVAVDATVALASDGHVVVREQGTDTTLDSGVWIYAGGHVLEQPSGTDVAREITTKFVARGPGFYDDGDTQRLFVLPIERKERRIGTIVTAVANAPYHRSRLEALVGSTVVAALALVGAGFALRFAIGRALRPVDEMTRQAAEWSAAALTERFGPHQRFRELQSLADTLNGVLDRQTATVRHERRLFAELSHELRTPLARILAEIDLLLARSHDPQQVRAAHEDVRETALAMDAIIETLLTAGRAEIVRSPGRADLPETVAQVLARRHPSGATAAPPVNVDIPAGLTVGVEAAVVERVLAPLLDNAGRFARGRITLRAERLPDAVTVDVSDDGPGVPPGSGESIFEPGTQLNPDPSHLGAGLGLPLARRLARAAAGDVTFEGGSTFRVRLPPG